MVEINNQRKAFLDMLAWSEELITDVRKPEIMVPWRHCRRRAILLVTPITLANLSAKPKTQINRRAGRYQLLSRWWDAYRKQLGLKDFSPKSQRTLWHCNQIKGRGALPMIDRGDIRQAIDHCSNIWASLPGAGYGQFGHKAWQPDCKIQRSGRNVQEIDVLNWSTAIISALVICIIVCLSWVTQSLPW